MATAEASSELDSVVEQVLNAAAQAVVSASTREVVRGMVQRLQSTNERLQQLENDNLTLRDALKNASDSLVNSAKVLATLESQKADLEKEVADLRAFRDREKKKDIKGKSGDPRSRRSSRSPEPAESAGKKPRREPSPRRHNPPPRRHSPPASQPPSSGAGNSLILGHVRPNVPSNQHMSSTQLSIIERLQDSVREQLAGKVPEVFIQGLLKAVDLHGSMQTLEKMHRYGETIVIVPTLRNIRIEFLRLKGHLDRTIGYDYYLFLTKLPQTIILVGIVNGRTDLSVGLADALRTAPVMDVTALDFRGMITANIRRGDGSGAAPR